MRVRPLNVGIDEAYIVPTYQYKYLGGDSVSIICAEID